MLLEQWSGLQIHMYTYTIWYKFLHVKVESMLCSAAAVIVNLFYLSAVFKIAFVLYWLAFLTRLQGARDEK